MRVEELRIGNWISCKQLDKFRVDEIRIDESGLYILRMYIGQLGGSSWCDLYPTDVKPIPLTEEIILKCGFEKRRLYTNDGDIGIYHHEKIGYISDNFSYCINTCNDRSQYDEIVELGAPMSGIHQLQNLYFDLTGKDLDVKF